ncbi:hypothetical protein [Paraglaciecola aestuariivivens]
MASLYALTQTPTSVGQTHFANAQWLTSEQENTSVNKKWTYLMANQICFKQKTEHAIRINKPEPKKLMLWLEKIISSQLCSNLFVEELQVDEMSFKRLKQLCEQYKVTLINLTLAPSESNNVIQGPW